MARTEPRGPAGDDVPSVAESLVWVNRELCATIEAAREALETYAEQPEDRTHIKRFADLMHSALGAVRMVDIQGAALLVEEIEAVADAVFEKRLEPDQEPLDALMRAVVQLPAYLDRIMDGGRDIPLILLPLLNDLRAVRGSPLLSENTLFVLNLSASDLPSPEHSEPSGEDISYVARRLRPHYQSALLGWLRGEKPDSNLATLSVVAENLHQAATSTAVFQLWWVIGGVLAALRDRGLEASASIKRLLGQTERQLKRLIDEGEAAFDAKPPVELLSNLLYYVGRATSDSERVYAIKNSFSLSKFLPEEDNLEAAREGLAAPSVGLMETVAEAIRQDLSSVKDVLDIYVRTGNQEIDTLSPQIEQLKKIADTLKVLGLAPLAREVLAQRETLRTLTTGTAEASEGVLLGMAAAMLGVEDQLGEDLKALVRTPDVERAAPPNRNEREFRQVHEAVLRECRVNLARIKELIARYASDPTEKRDLDALPGQLSGIKAGLLMLEKERALEVAERITRYVSAVILGGGDSPSPMELDRLADAIVSLEYYIETLQAGRSEPGYMIDNADTCLTELEEALPAEEAVPEEPALPAGAAAPTAQAPAELAPMVAEARDSIDPELLELFIEEAKEEIVAVNQSFPSWRETPDSRESLIALRRSFHTLKGSGRMVGAQVIGEFAWAVESLLNRLISRTLPLSPAVFEFVSNAVDALPHLVEQLEVGTRPPFKISELIDRAGALTEGGRGPVTSLAARLALPGEEEETDVAFEEDETQVAEDQLEPAQGTVDERTEVAEAAARQPPGPGEPAAPGLHMDTALARVFADEVASHLLAVRRFLQEARKHPAPYVVPEPLHRAWHTLLGCARTAEAVPVAEIAGPLYRYVNGALESEGRMPVEVVSVMAEAVETIDHIVARINRPEPLPDSVALLERIEALPLPWLLAEGERGLEELEIPAEFELPEDLETRPEEPAARPAGTAPAGPPPVQEEHLARGPEQRGVEPALPALEESPPGGPAEPAPVAEPAEEAEYDSEIAETFAEEAAELLETADSALQTWTAAPGERAPLAELKRVLHTLKGGARMAGLSRMGTLSHELESLLDEVSAGRAPSTRSTLDMVQYTLDALQDMRERLLVGQPLGDIGALLAHIRGAAGAAPAPEAAGPAAEPVAEPVVPDALMQAAEASGPPALAASEELIPERHEMARVDAELLDELLNNAGEISIFRSRLEQQVSSMGFSLTELAQTIARLREQLRKLELETEAQILHRHQEESRRQEEFDPLELDRYSTIQQLSRALAESASDLTSIQEDMDRLAQESEGLLVQQARVTTELQDGLMRTRMVPFSKHAQRLSRIVRQTGMEVGKHAELRIEGGSGELDRQVLERMMPPFEHMLRNSVVHGIEPPAQRQQRGKPETALISIRLHREGSEMVIEVVDDGAGLDVAAIKHKAAAHGLIRPGDTITDSDALQLILQPGFSTASRVTQAAGRGVGMDVVANEVRKLGGSLDVHSQPGAGTRFSIRLPFTLAITQALLVRAGEEHYAIPLPAVEGIVRLPGQEVLRYLADNAPSFMYGGQGYRFQHLGLLLGGEPAHVVPEANAVPAILVRAGEHSSALVVDEMLGSREVVVKSVGPQIASIRGVSGATILGDGSIALILDVAALVRGGALPQMVELPARREREERLPLALVVDDSITVRRVTKRLLERNGMRVVTARDGVDAIAAMQEEIPDVMVLDIEMPRMDGYEVVSHVRNDPRLRDLPIVMVTSRVGEKHRAYGLELGVNEYLGKPYQESQLLAAIAPLIRE